MRINLKISNGLLLGILIVLVNSCVKEINPILDSKQKNKVVVTALLTDQPGYQYVDVSWTSSIKKPVPTPIKGCVISLESKNGPLRYYQEYKGKYRIKMDTNEINLASQYRIHIVLPNYQVVESSWESFFPDPPIERLYYENESVITRGHYNSDTAIGCQFFIDFKGNNQDSRFYKYDLTETYEFHSKQPLEWWYDGVVHHVVPPDNSKRVCYNTMNIRDVFVLSTDNLSKNEYQRLRLNFVDKFSQRLAHKYSLLVKQLSISQRSYTYWNQMKVNKHQEGGLYDNQPISIHGNFKNSTDTTLDVLGYFDVSKVTQKRIFVNGGYDIIDNSCTKAALRMGLREISSSDYPVYLDGDDMGYRAILISKACVDCTALGGTTTKPDFWP